MVSSRFSLARDRGLIDLPGGGLVLAVLPPAELDDLDPARTQVVTGFAPDAALWRGRGFDVVPDIPDRADAALVFLPRQKLYAKALITRAVQALPPGGLLILDGQKVDGIESILRDLKPVLPPVEVLSKAHGKLASFCSPDPLPPQLAGWTPDMLQRGAAITTALSGFSADKVDPGSALLADHLPDRIKGRAADLGAGWGFLSLALLDHDAITALDLVEADWHSLQAAQENIDDPRAAFHWADVTTFRPDQRYDLIVTNPPFHTARKPDPALGQAFIAAAARMLAPSGTLALVANRHLPYEAALRDHFAQTDTIADADGFKVLHAAKPKKSAP